MCFRSRTQTEKLLYEPIRDRLKGIFVKYIYPIPSKKLPLQREPTGMKKQENPYLEIVGDNRRFSNEIKNVFDEKTLNIITKEGYYPDIVGHFHKKPKSKKEIIVVEIKDDPLHLVDVAQAKFYEDIFKPKFTLLISSKGIPPENVNFLLKNREILGNVIILRYFENYHEEARWFKINKKFEKVKIPEPFKDYLA